MKTNYLVLGATGGIGYAVVIALLQKKIPTTILVRKYEVASKLFGSNNSLEIIIGDANDATLLNKLCAGKTHVFHGLNTSYDKWSEVMPPLTSKVIDAASLNKATLVFPGNNYNYGSVKEPITEITPFHATSDLGKVRVELEELLQDASQQGRVNVLVVRLSEVWGPNVTNKSFEPVFSKAIEGRVIPWFYTIDVPQQMVYNMDAGRAIVELSLKTNCNISYSVYNYAGEIHSSRNDFFKKVTDITNMPLKTAVTKKGLINVLSYLNPTLKALKSLQYKYENTILLDDSKFKKAIPDFAPTLPTTAILDTVDWFKENKVNPQKQLRKQNRKKALVDFVADNLSIGVFPFIIGVITMTFPAFQSIAVLIGVVAGIYWSPFTRNMFRKLFSTHQITVIVLLLMTTEFFRQLL